ncbi:membrane-spanning 4-domains subfamily A member 10 [Ursus arctos]|uniref:membrane-spanning 4-domains subfamily A member 10 n=1 Tax=Ursus arctos TaxID=9644 RepID=UPI0020178819|nr:membrane-spanning 4-domains subfamily A member 10 [Ursus arctos]XP_026343452.2 membrane-spanning 4-domains subfamily A member 10 [Ursus arctos]
MAASSEWRSQGQPRSLAHFLTAEAYGAAGVIPRPEVRELPPWQAQELPPWQAQELPPWQAQDPTQPGQISLPPQLSLPAFPPPAWYQKRPRKRQSLLKLLGAFHVVIALLCSLFGGCLVSTVKSLHLVVLKSWYPFWGAASFLISGILVIVVELFSKTYLKTLCLIAHALSCFCVLAGLFVVAKDLFLESPFDFPIWTPYPSSTVHIQRLEVALLCFTVLEFFLLGSTTVAVCRNDCASAEKDELSLVAEAPGGFRLWSTSPPPSYEDVTRGGM